MPAFYHYLFAFTLIANASALRTAYLATPRGQLYAYGLSFAVIWAIRIIFLSFALLAYWLPWVCVMVCSYALLMAAYNAGQLPLTRGLGEEGVLALAMANAAKEPFWPGLLARIQSSLYFALLALGALTLSPQLTSWGFWVAAGIAIWSIELFSVQVKAYFRFRKLARAESAQPHVAAPLGG